MKKILSVLLAAVMALSLAACGGNQNSGSSSSGETATKAAETKAECRKAGRSRAKVIRIRGPETRTIHPQRSIPTFLGNR